MEELVILEGIVTSVVFEADDSDFVIFRLQQEEQGAGFTVTGRGGTPLVGDRLELKGQWIQHKRYGRQFSAVTWHRFVPQTTDGIERFLGSGAVNGIGPALAHRIVSAFGTATMDILEKDAQRLLEIEGIGKKKLALITESFCREKEVNDLAVELENHGVAGRYAQRLLQIYGGDADYVLHHEPYRLIHEVDGIGFKTADQIALSFGMDPQSEERLEAGLDYVLQDMTLSGHVCVPVDELNHRAAALLRTDAPLGELLDDIVGAGQAATAFYQGITYAYTYAAYLAEKETARCIRGMTALPPVRNHTHVELFLDRWQDSCHIELAEQQRRAVEQSVEAGILVITGGPGTGKTTVVRTIIRLAEQESLRIALCAPTGRAAKRLSETTGRNALTIHRMLIPNGYSGGMQQFEYNDTKQLPADLIIVDEVSMLDLEMMYHLLQALKPKCRCILVGDADQLPSVGAGAVLHDIIQSGEVPVVRLDTIFRQKEGGGIVTNAHRINAGRMPVFECMDDFCFVPIDDEEEGARKVCALYAEELRRTPDVFSVQVLSPMYRQPCGVDNLNHLIQKQANGPEPGKSEYQKGTVLFRVGDKILQKKNNYEKGVFNGDIGEIFAIVKDTVHVRYPEQEVKYEGKELDEITLAYAVTVHKSQGSEYQTVIMVLVDSHFIMLQRNLLYTAVTRAKKKVILVGTQRALRTAVNNVRTSRRSTLLAQRLRQEELC